MNEHDSSNRRNDDGDRYEKPRRNRDGADGYRKSSGSYGDRDDRRGGYRKNYGDRDDRRGGYRRDNDDRGDRGGYRKSYGDRDDRRGGYRRDNDDRGGYRKSWGDRDDRRGGYRRDNDDRGGDRGGYRKNFGDRDDRRGGYRRDNDDRGERGGYRKNFGDRDDRRGGYRRDNDERGERGGYRKSYGDRDDRRGGYRRDNDERGERGGYRKSYGDREERGGRRDFGDRKERRDFGDRKDRQFRDRDQRDEAPINTKGDPELSEEITADMLDPAMRKHLQTLSKENAEIVARHLVMAGALLNDDPQTAHEHALAAQRHGGRVGIVREALAMTAYSVGAYNLALREIHALRRLTGTNAHVVIEADCERGMQRPERALEVIAEADRETLTDQFKVELALVESGARADLGEHEAGLLVVEDELTQSYEDELKARLYSVKADRLEELERTEEAEAARAEALRLDPDVLGSDSVQGEEIDEAITLVEDE